MRNLKAIYDKLDASLRAQADSPAEFDKRVDKYLSKYGHDRIRTDDEYHWILTYVAFYSGFRAKTVDSKKDTICNYLYGYKRASSYDEKTVQRILTDPGMIKSRRKTLSSIENGRAIAAIVGEYGSFQAYLDSFKWRESLENCWKLRRALIDKFWMIGPVTSLHFMTDVGMPVLKPDRVVLRVLSRLDLVSDKKATEATIREAVGIGQGLSEATGKSIREIDIKLVSLGLEDGNEDFGVHKGICVEEHPRCNLCLLKDECAHFSKSAKAI